MSGFFIGWGNNFIGWGDGEAPVAEAVVDGGRARRKRRPARRLDTYRTHEDIRREQLETERYLASIEKVAPAVVPEPDEAEAVVPAVAQPILADVAARAASAVQAKLEEAAQAATAARLADDKRRRTLALLLALD